MTSLAEGARYPLIVGDEFTADIPSGSELRVDPSDGTAGTTVTADADGASHTPSARSDGITSAGGEESGDPDGAGPASSTWFLSSTRPRNSLSKSSPA